MKQINHVVGPLQGRYTREVIPNRHERAMLNRHVAINNKTFWRTITQTAGSKAIIHKRHWRLLKRMVGQKCNTKSPSIATTRQMK